MLDVRAARMVIVAVPAMQCDRECPVTTRFDGQLSEAMGDLKKSLVTWCPECEDDGTVLGELGCGGFAGRPRQTVVAEALATNHSPDEWLQQKMGESLSRCCALVHVVQLRV